MADLLVWANTQATAARAAGQARLPDTQLAEITAWYRGAVAKGITDNSGKRSRSATDGLRLARRFRDHQDMILRFTTDLAVGFTSNQAERDRPSSVPPRPPPADRTNQARIDHVCIDVSRSPGATGRNLAYLRPSRPSG